MKKLDKYKIAYLLMLCFLCILLSNIICYSQNIVFGIGFGYSNLYLSNIDINVLNSLFKPSLGYEILGYLSIPLFNDIDLIVGLVLISKGFNISEQTKYELLYLQSIFSIRFLNFRSINSKTFIEIGFNAFGKLLKSFITNYDNFSIEYDNSTSFFLSDNSLNIGTGIIIKNLIFALNIYLQMDSVLTKEINLSDYSFNNYNMILSIAIII